MYKACLIIHIDNEKSNIHFQKIVSNLLDKQYEIHVYGYLEPKFQNEISNVIFHQINVTDLSEQNFHSELFNIVITNKQYKSLAKHIFKDKKNIFSFEKYDGNKIPAVPKKLLIIRYGAIGDVVHTTNMYRAIRKAYKQAEIHYMTFSTPSQLLKNDKDIDKLIVINKTDISLFGSKNFCKQLKNEKYDLAINLQPNFKTKVLLLKAGINNVVNYKKNYDMHAVVNFFDTAKKVFKDIECDTSLKIYLDKSIEQQLTECYKNYPRPFVVLNAGGTKSSRQGRCYPINKWLELGKEIQENFNGTIFITGLEEDVELLGQLNEIPNSVNLVGKLSLQEVASLYKISDLLVSGDSGPLHIATAVGTKVVGLFGSMMITRTGPYGNGHKAIASNISCVGCNKRKCIIPKYRLRTYQKCMESISVSEIFKVISEMRVDL